MRPGSSTSRRQPSATFGSRRGDVYAFEVRAKGLDGTDRTPAKRFKIT